MINAVNIIPVVDIEEGAFLDLIDDEYAQEFEELVDLEVLFEVVDIDYDEENIIFINENSVRLHFPFTHSVHTAQM